MSACKLHEPCVTYVMQLIEVSPEPFILEPEEVVCEGKLCEAVVAPGPFQGPPLEMLIGREKLLAFMFNNEFPPIVTDPTVVPLPAAVWMLLASLAALLAMRRAKP